MWEGNLAAAEIASTDDGVLGQCFFCNTGLLFISKVFIRTLKQLKYQIFFIGSISILYASFIQN